MAQSFYKFVKGILLKPETSDPSDNLEGSAWYNSTVDRFKGYAESAVRVLVTENQTQTLTSKTIDGDDNTVQDLALTSLKTNLTDANKFLNRDGSGVVVSNSKSVPTGDVVGTSDSQILTNKTIDGDLNTLSDISITSLKTDAGAANTFISRDGSGVVISTKAVPTGTVVGTSDSQTLTNKTLTDPEHNTTVYLEQGSTPSTPAADKYKVYVKTDGFMYILNDAAVETQIGSGGSSFTVDEINAGQTLADLTIYLVDTSGGPITVTLPAITLGMIIEVIDQTGNANSNTLTIDTADSALIIGQPTYTITNSYGAARFISGTSNWSVG